MAENDNSTVNGLLEQLRKANGESATRRATIKTLRAKIEEMDKVIASHDTGSKEAATKLAAYEAEIKDLNAKAAAGPAGAQAEIDRLKGEIRQRDHAKAFGDLYAEKALAEDGSIRINPDVSIERLMSVLGYKAEADKPDLAAVKASILAMRDSDKYLFATGQAPNAAAGAAPPPVTPPTVPPGPGSPRGAADNATGSFKVTRAQLRDPEWMRSNQGQISKAQKEGRLSIETQAL